VKRGTWPEKELSHPRKSLEFFLLSENKRTYPNISEHKRIIPRGMAVGRGCCRALAEPGQRPGKLGSFGKKRDRRWNSSRCEKYRRHNRRAASEPCILHSSFLFLPLPNGLSLTMTQASHEPENRKGHHPLHPHHLTKIIPASGERTRGSTGLAEVPRVLPTGAPAAWRCVSGITKGCRCPIRL
jgi:hypothetical protein